MTFARSRAPLGALLAALVLTASLAAPQARAQALADRIPADAVVYVGWAGTDKLAGPYGQSNLKAVLDASELPQFLANLGPSIIARLQQEQSRDAQMIANDVLPVVLALGEAVCKYPTALYVGPMDFESKVPLPRIAVICDAQQGAQALADRINALIARIPPDAPVKIRVQVQGGAVVVSNAEMPARPDEPLSGREAFKKALAQGRPAPAMVAFVDVEKITAAINVAIAGQNERARAQYQKVMQATGLGGLKRITVTAGFQGKEWGSDAFIEIPAPRTGLLGSLVDSKPLSDDTLKWAPKSTNWLVAGRFDFAAFTGGIRKFIAELEPRAAQQMDQALAQVNQQLGFDLEKDLLAALGDEWLAFNSDATGHGVLGLTLVNRLRDPAKAKNAIIALEKQFNGLLAGMLQRQGMTLAMETTKAGDLEIHYLASPALSPAWAIKGSNLYVALYPQVLAAAADHDGTVGNSILANESFVAARKRLVPNGSLASISYMDLPRLAPRGYPMVLLLQRLGFGFMDLFGMKTPAMILPPLNRITPHLTPSIAGTWVDDAGVHCRSTTPFPGAGLLGGEQALVTTVGPAAVAIILPALTKARGQARQVAAMSNLRQIGMGIMMYANENKGNMPPDMGSLAPYIMSAQVFISPRSNKSAPPGMMEPKDLSAWANANADYVYVGAAYGKLTRIQRAAETIIAHEKFELSDNGMTPALFADGHVEIMPVFAVQQKLQAKPDAQPKP